MMTVAEKIENILAKRKELLPLVEGKLSAWEELSKEIPMLKSAFKNIAEYKNASPELKSLYEEFEKQPFRELILNSMELFEKLKNRMKRETINIGVSGQARVGKSTLLQTISGLSDDQIPTGSGIPVTAVRSRIFHSLGQPKAIIRFHTYSSFRKDVLEPYHNELKLGSPPDSLSDFEKYSYPQDRLDNNEMDEVKKGLYRRLKEMHQDFSTYREYLTGAERVFDLSEIRNFVSYPTKEQIKLGNVQRKYLAVKDVKIECKFPQLEIQKIGLIDLPGLGELAADAEDFHIQGLQNEVDFVLFVKRAVEGFAYWRNEDAKALKIIGKARGAIAKGGNFVHIVSNEGGTSADLIDAMLGHILREVNDGTDGKNYRILRTNATDQNSVYDNAVNPVLAHLSDRLAEMDKDLFENANEISKTNARIISDKIRELFKKTDESMSEYPKDKEELIDNLHKELYENIASNLRKKVEKPLFYKARYRDYMNKPEEDRNKDIETEKGMKDKKIELSFKEDKEQYLSKVIEAEQNFNNWVNNAFGFTNKEKWIEKTEKRVAVQTAEHGWLLDEYNRIRVYLSEQFASSMDIYLNAKTQKLRSDIGEQIRDAIIETAKSIHEKGIQNSVSEKDGMLFDGVKEEEILDHFVNKLSQIAKKCPTLLKSVKDLLSTQITYRAHLHPRVRKCLDNLLYKLKQDLPYDDLFQKLKDDSTDAARAVKHELAEETNFIHEILHASCEQFVDSLIRSADSETEFKRFVRAYKELLLPDIFKGLDSENALSNELTARIGVVTNILDKKIGEVKNV